MRLHPRLVILPKLYPCVEMLTLDWLSDGCKEVLTDVESKLDKYQSLGSNEKRSVHKIGWAATDIEPIRVRLMNNAICLSTFNTTLARCVKRYVDKLSPSYADQRRSSSHIERTELSEARILQSQATILHKLNELQLEGQEGTREAPALSLVTLENFNEEETWEGITKELQSTDLDNEHINSNQEFIRSWVSQVMLADVDEERGKCFP